MSIEFLHGNVSHMFWLEAVQEGHLSCVEELLKGGAFLNSKTIDGYTPFVTFHSILLYIFCQFK
jgi:hypothetical protein